MHQIASRFSVPSSPSLDRIGSNPNEPARNESKPLVAVQADLKTRTVKDEDRGDAGGGQGSIRGVGEEEGGETGGGDQRGERTARNAEGKSKGGWGMSNGTGGWEEEEAVAVIAGVLRDKFGPQIVREEVEEWGGGIGSREDEEEVEIVKEEEAEEEEEERVEGVGKEAKQN
ncbi:unnamed protein product [Closterium sp. NIES-65]|nr:unnamed protein product [Closterium sp. NIES-65]